MADQDVKPSPVEVAQCLAWYSHNVEPEDWVEVIYPGRAKTYVDEKVRTARSGFFDFFAALDVGNKAKLVADATERYAADARAMVTSWNVDQMTARAARNKSAEVEGAVGRALERDEALCAWQAMVTALVVDTVNHVGQDRLMQLLQNGLEASGVSVEVMVAHLRKAADALERAP